jgi:hypothetical protein
MYAIIFSNGSIGFKYEEDKMKHKQLITFGSVLVLVILLATACASLATPKNITVTFDETCTMEGPKTISAGKNTTIDLIGNLNEHGDLGIAILTLDPDKTLKDLQELGSAGQPPWSQRIAFYSFPSDGNTYSIDLNVVKGPIYFVCFYEDLESLIGALGPIQVEE